MKIILCDKNPKITEAWTEEFRSATRHDVQIHTGDFRELYKLNEPLVMCTAGNSYGIMGGGLDLVIAQTFEGVEYEIREKIRREYHGELPVGHTVTIYLEEKYKPFFVLYYTPTMRSPTRLRNAHNVYLAMRSVLRIYDFVSNLAGFREKYLDSKLVIPGFGGACGGLHPEIIAHTMKIAFQRHQSSYMPMTHGQMAEEDTFIEGVCGGY